MKYVKKQWGMFKGEKLNITATNDGPKPVKVFLLLKLFFQIDRTRVDMF